MKFFIQAAALLAASASVWAIPPGHHSSVPSSEHDVASGLKDFNGPSVLFSVPCPECSADAEEELDIELKIEASDLTCQAASIVVNDVRLLYKQPSTAANPIRFKATTSNQAETREVTGHWSMACLEGEVTLLSLILDQVLGHSQGPVKSGFSASFKQQASLEVLRVERAPINDVHDSTITHIWTQVQQNPEFVVVAAPVIIDEGLPDEFKDELRRLHEIKAHMGRLQHQYMRQEHRVFAMIKQDFSACHGASCLVQTAIRKAPDFFELVKAHFKHRPDWSKIHKHGDAPFPWDGPDKLFDEPSFVIDIVPEHTPFPSAFDEVRDKDMSDFPPPPPLPPHHHDGPPPPPPPHHHDGPPPPPHHNDHPPPPHHHGQPPPSHHNGHSPPPHHDGHPPPPHHDGHPPPPPPPSPPSPPHHHKPPGQDHGHPPWAGHRGPEHHRPGHPGPHFFHRHGPHRHPLIFSVGSLLFFVVVASLLFKCVRAKTGLFRDRRRQRDRATRREECRSQAAYRRAAVRHRWGQWWSQFRRPQSTSDYEEKRARILNQEDTLEDVMQSEIQDLRRAHEMVGDMVRAEEGRNRLYHEANFGSSLQPTSSPHGLQYHSTNNTGGTEPDLPLYQPPPPSYDEELEGDMMVVDGFSYTPSGSDETPGSSVVDCDVRMSFETTTALTQ